MVIEFVLIREREENIGFSILPKIRSHGTSMNKKVGCGYEKREDRIHVNNQRSAMNIRIPFSFVMYKGT